MGSKSIGLHIPPLLRDAFETAIVFLYSAECRVCKEFLRAATSVPYICDNCWQHIQFLEPPWCDICGTPGSNRLCEACAISPPRYGKLRSIAFYQTPLQQAIHFFKFQKKEMLAKHLIQLLNAHIPPDCNIAEYDLILPVPIHKKRLRERGFNQTTLLANGIAKPVGVPVLTDILIRPRHTVPQSGLGGTARQQNIVGAFEVQKPEIINGKRLLVIDDVFTTGATIREVTNELWTADPAEIDVLTLARTANTQLS